MKITVSVDLDGTISDQLGKMREIAERYGITDHSWTEYYNGIYKCYSPDDRQLAEIIFEDNLEEFILGQNPHKGARQIWEKLLANNKIIPYITTSRKEENKDLTMKWLEDNGFTGAEDVLFLQDKTQAPTNTIVDDHPKHINSYVDKARLAYLIDRPYNQDAQVLRRVKNLGEFYTDVIQFI